MKIRPVGAELFHVNEQTDMIVFFAILRTGLKCTDFETYQYLKINKDQELSGSKTKIKRNI
jgi:hypothetical protein